MAFDFDQALASTDFSKVFGAKPKPEDAGVLRDVADTGLQLAQGVLQGGNMLASTFGADNAAAKAFRTGAEWLASNFSDELKWKQLTAAQDSRAAELSGSTWEEIKAGARAVGADPVGFLANAAGTTLPTIAAAFLPGGQGAVLGRLAATSLTGAAQGAGAVKSQIYETVEDAWKKQGASDEEASSRAAAAQAYLGSNAGQIALGTALGALAGGSGVEAGIIGRGLLGGTAQNVAEAVAIPTNSLVARALARTPRFIKEGVKEALPEGLQGGQEQVAGNVALQNEGFDRPTFSGVAGAATMEALAGAGMGAAVSPLTSSARMRKAEEDAKRQDAEDRLATAGSVDEIVKAANDLALTPLDKGLDGTAGAQPQAPGEASAEFIDSPFSDRVLTLREQLADPSVREAIRERFGDEGLNNATYYAGVADKVGPDTLPEKTRDNLLSVAEQMVSAAILQPIGTRPLTDQRSAGNLALPAPDDGQGGVPGIGLDTAPTGTMRVDAQGNAAPETRADLVSARDRERQRRAQEDGLGRGTPRGEAPQPVPRTSPLVEQQRAARRRTEGQPLDDIGQADPVLSYVDNLRQTNTPAARAFVREFEAGRITRRDIIEVMQSQPADPLGGFQTDGLPADTASERLRRARDEGRKRQEAQAARDARPQNPAPEAPGGIQLAPSYRTRQAVDPTPEVQDRDLTTNDGMPYGSKSGANVRARREGLGPENVVEIPGAGWVVRPNVEASSEPVGDVDGTAGGLASGGDGRTPTAVGSGVAVRRMAADAGGREPDAAGTPLAGGAEAAPAGDGGGADAALTEPAKEVRPTLQDARINAALDKPVRENGEQMTRRQWVERKVSDGLKTRITQEDRIKPMSRMAYFRANNEEQRAHERRVKEAGKKDVYWIGDYEVTKIEHDYAKRLAEQPATPTPAPQGGEPSESSAFTALAKRKGFNENGPAPGEWVMTVSNLGDVILRQTSAQGETLRVEVSADYMGKRLGSQVAEGEAAIDEAIKRARDGINAGREKMAREVVADERGVEGPANVSLAAPAVLGAPASDQNDTAAKPKPHAELEGKTIEQEMEVEGHKVVRRRDAAKALRALDEREASLRALLDCLKGGG